MAAQDTENRRKTKNSRTSRSTVPQQLSARHERFCQVYSSGRTATDAYKEAYGNTRTAKAAASRLLTFVNVQSRILALREEAAQGAVLDLLAKRAFLRRVVCTPIGEVSRESDLCQKYEAHTADDVTYLKVSMPDKLRAIELDSKLAGHFNEPHEASPAADGLLQLLGQISSRQ